jgi:hypothetical protein
MEKGVVKLMVFNGEDFGYWKNQTRNYLLSQGRAIREIVQDAYVISATLDHMTQGEVQRYENNYKALNLITNALGRNVYDRLLHLETANDVWLKLGNTYEGFYEIKSSHNDTYNRQYQIYSRKPGGPLAYSDNEHAKQLLYALNDHVWGMKITALEESANFATLDIEKLFSMLKSHELSRKGRPNHDTSLTIKALITSAHVGGHDANPTNTISSTLEFALSFLAATSDEQYESIPDDEIGLLARKFCALHKFCKERRRPPRGRVECGDTTHFIADCPKWKQFDSSNKYDYINRNDYSNKGDHKKKNCFGDKKKKKKFQKIMT